MTLKFSVTSYRRSFAQWSEEKAQEKESHDFQITLFRRMRCFIPDFILLCAFFVPFYVVVAVVLKWFVAVTLSAISFSTFLLRLRRRHLSFILSTARHRFMQMNCANEKHRISNTNSTLQTENSKWIIAASFSLLFHSFHSFNFQRNSKEEKKEKKIVSCKLALRQNEEEKSHSSPKRQQKSDKRKKQNAKQRTEKKHERNANLKQKSLVSDPPTSFTRLRDAVCDDDDKDEHSAKFAIASSFVRSSVLLVFRLYIARTFSVRSINYTFRS